MQKKISLYFKDMLSDTLSGLTVVQDGDYLWTRLWLFVDIRELLYGYENQTTLKHAVIVHLHQYAYM